MTSSKHWDWVALALGLLAFGWLLWVNRVFFHDDAYISLRYARNLAEHGVLEWNLGERVEGYTNFLHVVFSAGLLKLGLGPEAAVRALNLSVVLTLFPAAVFAARRLAPETPFARVFALLAIGATPGIAVWVLGGLEASVVATLVAWGTLGVIIAIQDGSSKAAFWGGLAFALSVLTRLDSAVFIAGSGLAVLIFAPGNIARRFWLAVLIAGVPAMVSLLHMVWRLDYYGLPFPLTFYAKTGVPMWIRFSFLEDLPLYILYGVPLLFVAIPGVLGAIRARGLALALAIPVVMQLLYVIWSGGDHMPGGRVIVLLTVPAVLVLLATDMRLPLAAAAAALSVGVGVISERLWMDPAAFYGTLTGQFFAKIEDPLVISLATAGSTPFHADHHTYIDQLGLNDPVIARRDPFPILMPVQDEPGHSKGDGAYILSREPDVIIIGSAEGRPASQPVFLSDAEMVEMDAFKECYVEKRSEIPYTEEYVARNPNETYPAFFIWYERVCAKTGQPGLGANNR